MLLDKDKALSVMKANFPKDAINYLVDFKNLFVFRVVSKDSQESDMDPYYSVDKVSGKVAGFSILRDTTPDEMAKLYDKQHI